LGQRQWAVSMSRPQSLFMACPQQVDMRNHPKAELPSLRIVEIPPGCSIQTDEWILQSSPKCSTVSTRNASIHMPRLRGVNWAVAQDPSDVNTDADGRLVNSSLQTSLETTLKRIASGKTGANDFGKNVRALEEGDKERRDGAQGLRQ
jgi:hypothetical protein